MYINYALGVQRVNYQNVVNGIAETSMQNAIERVKALPDYATNGEYKLLCATYSAYIL